jgi:hypothetical protein
MKTKTQGNLYFYGLPCISIFGVQKGFLSNDNKLEELNKACLFRIILASRYMAGPLWNEGLMIYFQRR